MLPARLATVMGLSPFLVIPPAIAAATEISARVDRPTMLSAETAQVEKALASGSGRLRDGRYRGGVFDAYYGRVQVEARVRGDALVDVKVLRHPSDLRTSRIINARALPVLKSEAIRAQDARVHTVSGATLTSRAFIRSLQSALDAAHR